MARNKKWMSLALMTALAVGTLSAQTTAAAAAPQVLTVYDDAVRNDFTNYSYATHSLTQTAVVHSGKQAVEMQPNGGNALYFYKDRVASVSQYDTLQFWVNGGAVGGQNMKLVIQAGGVPVATKTFYELIPIHGILANQWVKYEVNLADLNIPNGIFDGIMIAGTTEGTQPTLFVDDITLFNKASVTPIPVVDGLSVYDDYLNSQFVNYSWAEHNVNQVNVVHTGIHAVQMTPNRDNGLYFYKDRTASTNEYDKLSFWINGGATGGQELKLAILSGGRVYAEKSLIELIPIHGILANQWVKYEMNLADLNLPSGLFDGIMLIGTTDGLQAPVYVDDVVLERKVTP